VASREPSTTIACVNAWHLLRTAHARVEQELSSELSRACGLSVSEFDALFYLHLHAAEDPRIGDLQAAVALSQPATSRLVARLEQRSLLCREPVPEDARAVILRLTDAGRRLLETATVIHTRIVNDVFASRFTDEEQATLLAILGRIAAR
jgi:DNA-binding MarR family transcriptional regulator